MLEEIVHSPVILYIPLIYKATLSNTLRTQIVSGMWPIFIFIFMQKCIFLSLSWYYKLSVQKTNTLQSFSYLAELPKRPKQKKSCSKNWLIGQLCVKTGVHTNFVDIDLFYPLLILHAKNVKLQWKFAKFLSNQFVLQLPFFFVITYNFAFLRSYSRYIHGTKWVHITILVEKFWSAIYISVNAIKIFNSDMISRFQNWQYKRYLLDC